MYRPVRYTIETGGWPENETVNGILIYEGYCARDYRELKTKTNMNKCPAGKCLMRAMYPNDKSKCDGGCHLEKNSAAGHDTDGYLAMVAREFPDVYQDVFGGVKKTETANNTVNSYTEWVNAYVMVSGDYCAFHEMSLQVLYDVTNGIQLGDYDLEQLQNWKRGDYSDVELQRVLKVDGRYYLPIQ
jgi:hypothetical protein